MIKFCPLRVLLILLASLSAIVAVQADVAAVELPRPYKAQYQLSDGGMSTQVHRELKPLSNGQWELYDSARVMFFSIEEKAQVRIYQNSVDPLYFEHQQKPGKNRNQRIDYNWNQQQASSVYKGETRQFPLDKPVYDKLSFQLQMTLDLATDNFSESKVYPLIDRGRIKQYRLSKIGSETLTLGTHTIDTLKLRQQRVGKEDETLIWVAPALDYLIVKIESTDDDKQYSMELISASLLR